MADDLENRLLHRTFVGVKVIATMHHRPFEEHKVNFGNGMLHQVFEELPLPAMRPEIAAVEKSLSFSFYKEGISIDGGMVNKVWGNSKVAYLERLPCFEMPEVVPVALPP